MGSRYNGRKLQVYLPKELNDSDTVDIKLKYIAYPNENSGAGSEAITDNKGLYFINPDGKGDGPVQVWTQGETEHNSKWFPTIDAPNERATHDLKITVEEKYKTISNGELVAQQQLGNGKRRDHWKMEIPHAPYLVALGRVC